MGIDVYLYWDGMTEEDKEAQMTGFSIHHGHVGYLREAYHGQPYATRVLVPEGWEDGAYNDGAGVPIAASVLRERLPATLEAARQRAKIVYDEVPCDPATLDSFTAFVRLAEHKEAETGKPCRVMVSY